MTINTAESATRVNLEHNLDAIREAWQRLWDQCPEATPFQSPAWLVPWWEQFGEGEPLAVTARRGGELRGLGLFYAYEGDPAAGRQLFFVGKAVSDYQDLLVAPGEDRGGVAGQILECLFAGAGAWRAAELDRLPPESPIRRAPAAPGLQASASRDGVCPVLRLLGRAPEEALPGKTRRELRSHLRRAQKQGRVEFATAGPADSDALLGELLRLHSRRWHAVGLPGVLSDERMNRFLTAAARGLLSAGLLRLSAMRLNGATVAALLAMLHRGRAYLYLTGFDPACSALEPISLLIAHNLRQAAQEGAEVIDLLQGGELYKYRKWAAEPRYTWRVRYVAAGSGPSGEQTGSER